jgi:hypothetical protein
MLLKTNIPETTLCLSSACVDFGDTDGLILNDRINQIQAIVSGNRCGHSPDAPRFFSPPDHHKRRPTVLDRAIDCWEEVYRKAKRFLGKLATSHDGGRQVRSERREAIAAVMQAIFHYIDLDTLKVGFSIGLNKFLNLDVKYIAKQTGLSVSRAMRALRNLTKAGYLEITRQYTKKEDGTFKGEASVRKINVQLFIDLGIDVQKLFFARDWKRKKEEKAKAKDAIKKLKGMVQAVTSFSSHLVSSKAKKGAPSINQDLIGKALELHRANPERSPSDYLHELKQLNE